MTSGDSASLRGNPSQPPRKPKPLGGTARKAPPDEPSLPPSLSGQRASCVASGESPALLSGCVLPCDVGSMRTVQRDHWCHPVNMVVMAEHSPHFPFVISMQHPRTGWPGVTAPTALMGRGAEDGARTPRLCALTSPQRTVTTGFSCMILLSLTAVLGTTAVTPFHRLRTKAGGDGGTGLSLHDQWVTGCL